MRFEEYLMRLMQIWCGVTGRSLRTHGAQLAKDGKLFARLESGRPVTTILFSSCLSFYRDGANWPDGRIPQEACDLLDNFANIATEVAVSSGKSDDLTGNHDLSETCAEARLSSAQEAGAGSPHSMPAPAQSGGAA